MSDEIQPQPVALAEPGGNGKGQPGKKAEQALTSVGVTGLRQYGGSVQEEFDPELRGLRSIKVYDEMRRNDPTVGIGLRAINWILGQVLWDVQAASEDKVDLDAKEFVESCMDDCSHTWSKVLRDALTCLPFGFSYMEITYKQRRGQSSAGSDVPSSQYDDGLIGWRKITLIGQDTLSRWDFDEDGGLRGFIQQPVGNTSRGEVTVPIEKSILFRIDDEKNNPEGVSLLRSCYLPWYLKKNLQEIEAIGIERDLSGVLVIYLPVNATTTDQTKAKQLLEQFKRDDMSGFTAPQFGPGEHERWRFEIINAPGSKGVDTDRAITRYQHEIARAFLTQFLLLGQGSTGSWALGRDQREMFEVALGAILRNMEETMNRFLIPPLMRLNQKFAKLQKYPELRAGRISKGDLQKFAQALTSLLQAGALTAGKELEKFIREEFELPDLPEEASSPPSGGAPPKELPKEVPPPSEGGQAKLTRGQIADLWQAGSINDTEFLSRLQAIGYSQEDASFLLKREKASRPKPASEPRRLTLSPAQRAEYGAETERIKENTKTSQAQERHRFQPAEWTYPNGHPRCLLCGDEEPVGGYCEGLACAIEPKVLPSHQTGPLLAGVVQFPDPEDDAGWDQLFEESLARLSGNREKTMREPYLLVDGGHSGHKGAHAGHSGGAKAKIKAEGKAANLLAELPEAARVAASSAGLKEVKILSKSEYSKVVGARMAATSVAHFDEDTGTIILRDGNPKAREVFYHEFAHSLDPLGSTSSKYGLSEDPEWLKASGWKQSKSGKYSLKATILNRPTSRYGETAPWEDFAETFTKTVTGSKFDRRVMEGESEGRYAYMQNFAKKLGFTLD